MFLRNVGSYNRQGVTSKKTAFFKVTALNPSNLTQISLSSLCDILCRVGPSYSSSDAKNAIVISSIIELQNEGSN
jgi:hypothetical protein